MFKSFLIEYSMKSFKGSEKSAVEVKVMGISALIMKSILPLSLSVFCNLSFFMNQLKLLKVFHFYMIFQSIFVEATWKFPRITRIESRVSSVSSNSETSSTKNSIVSELKTKLARSKNLKIFKFNDENDPVEQVYKATNDLINFMKHGADFGDLSIPKPRINYLLQNYDGEIIFFPEIVDENIINLLEKFQTNLSPPPLSLIFELLSNIWSQVKTITHRAIFEEVMKWAIKVVSKNYPKNYYKLIDFIISNDIQFPSYQKAILKAKIMSKDKVKFIVDKLLRELLELNSFGEYKFYDKFNVYFMELAMKYPNFSKLSFIRDIILPPLMHETPILKLIYYSSPLIEILSSNPFDPELFTNAISVLTNHCIETKLSASILAEQYQIIFNLNRKSFAEFDFPLKFGLMKSFSKSLKTILAETNNLFPGIPNRSEYALLVQTGYCDYLLLQFILILNPIFSIDEFEFIINFADRIEAANQSFGTLLTLLGSISLPEPSADQKDYSNERNLRLNLYIQVISSIQEQNLDFYIKDDDDYNSNSLISSMSLSKMKTISWILPKELNESNYELISIADLLFIPLLFIQRVFRKDYRQSVVFEKYLRMGKPNYSQFSKIINDLLQDKSFGTFVAYPIVEVIFQKWN